MLMFLIIAIQKKSAGLNFFAYPANKGSRMPINRR